MSTQRLPRPTFSDLNCQGNAQSSWDNLSEREDLNPRPSAPIADVLYTFYLCMLRYNTANSI